MRCTVFGASGFIGSHLVHHLQQKGCEVLQPGRDERAFREPLGHAFYCIGLTADFRSRPFETVKAHVSVLANILETAAFDSLVYLSSTRVYSGAASGREDAHVSVTPNDASDIYNISKLMGESLCLNCGKSNVRAARLSNVIGSDTGSQNFVFDISRDALKGHVKLRSDPASAKDYIHVGDVVEILERITVDGRHRLYNVASGRKVSHGQWLDKLSELTGCTVEIEPGSPRFDFPDVDITRMMDEFKPSLRPVVDDLPAILDSLKSETREASK